jgi:hypothetical protein
MVAKFYVYGPNSSLLLAIGAIMYLDVLESYIYQFNCQNHCDSGPIPTFFEYRPFLEWIREWLEAFYCMLWFGWVAIVMNVIIG